MIIDDIILRTERYPLKNPYRLSFVTLHHFDSFQVTLFLKNGQKTTSEVVPLLGYTSETPESILDYLSFMKGKLIGLSLMEARNIIANDINERPFHTTAFLTAIDLFSHSIDDKSDLSCLEFVYPVSTKNVDEFCNELRNFLNFDKTIKIKLCGDPEQDIFCLKYLAEMNKIPKKKIRLDANQKYCLDDAKKLCHFLSQSNFENYIAYLEQPLDAKQWDAHYQLQEEYPTIPIMLDESIVTISDIKKAFDYKIPFIKLKLFKQGGIIELLSLAQLANQFNIKVVLGNGVATEICNKIEIDLHVKFPHLFFGASEANGFMKILHT